MRKSLVCGFVAIACIGLMGSGCQTIRSLCKPCKKRYEEAQAAKAIAATNVTIVIEEVLDPGEVAGAQTGVPFEQLAIDANAKLDAVQYAYDSSLLSPKEVARVEKAAQYLLNNPDRVMHVDGHCDERGSNEYNLSLGEQRAQAVRKYLMDLGIDGARIQTRSFGKEKPLDAGHAEEAWAKNRRAEFVVYLAKK
ncbi:MAG: OmpA family protein [bacterium]